MPTEKQPERGVRSPYQARYGLTVGKCRGLDLSHDSSVIADEALVDATNARVHDGVVLSRYGQNALNQADPLNGCVQGLIDIDGLGTRFALAQTRTTVFPPPNYSDVSLFDTAAAGAAIATPELEGVPTSGQELVSTTRDTSLPRYVFQWWNGRVVFGGRKSESDGDPLEPMKLWELLVPEEDPASPTQSRELFDLRVPGEGSDFIPSSMCVLPSVGSAENGGPLYFGTMGGGVVAYVNGELRRLQADATWSDRVILFQYNNRLYGIGGDVLRVQDGWLSGASPVSSTWSAVTVPGTASGLIPMSAIEWGGFGWIGGQVPAAPDEARMLKIDDSSGSPVCTDVSVAAGITGFNSVDELAVAFGNTMFVGYTVPGVGITARVSEWDGSMLVNLTPEFWTESEAMIPRMLGTNDRLYILGYGSDGPNDNGLWVWDGSSETLLLGVGVGVDSWFDMVLF
jgi:hypothetical protein